MQFIINYFPQIETHKKKIIHQYELLNQELCNFVILLDFIHKKTNVQISILAYYDNWIIKNKKIKLN